MSPSDDQTDVLRSLFATRAVPSNDEPMAIPSDHAPSFEDPREAEYVVTQDEARRIAAVEFASKLIPHVDVGIDDTYEMIREIERWMRVGEIGPKPASRPKLEVTK